MKKKSPKHNSSDQERQRHHRKQSHGSAAAARSIADAVVIKDEDIFFLTCPDGSVPLGGRHGFGIYHHDCRFLNGYEVSLNGCRPNELVANADAGSMAVLELTNPDFHGRGGEPIPKQEIGIKCERAIDARRGVLHDRITLQNFGLATVAFPLSLTFQAGFEDVFTVRNFLAGKPGETQPARWQGNVLAFRYKGRDGRFRGLDVHFSQRAHHRGTSALFDLRLGPKESWQVMVSIELREAERTSELRPRAAAGSAPNHAGNLQRSSAQWLHRHTEARSDSELLNDVIGRSLRDLRMLRNNLDGEHYFAAGIPWFAALFGRDSIITALEMLAYEPAIAEQTLRLLAAHQGKVVDHWRDEEPGKILHELRVGELARLGEIPHTPYYGTVDATPLFLILIAQHAAWTGDLALFRELRPNVDRALEWIDRYGQHNGYLAYCTRSKKGLANQGWKDSGDAIVHRDGSLAEPPIALVEVQGYVYRAKLEIAALMRRVGEHERAAQLEGAARDLRARFNRDFWIDGQRMYALALERDHSPLTVVTSNPGHALWCGIADEAKARRTAHRLMQDDMFSGWGIRTLASSERAYNPLGYHLGTVWPHDNAIIAAGLRRCGCDDEARQIFTAIVHAAVHFNDRRLPEVFSGFSRKDYGVPVRYPVACHPQAWSAGAVPLLLQIILGLVPDAFDRRLRIVRPLVPEVCNWLELRGLRVGQARCDLRFERGRDRRVHVDVLRTDGDLDVVVDTDGAFGSIGDERAA